MVQRLTGLAALVVLLCQPQHAQTPRPAGGSSARRSAAPAPAWPHPIPARIKDGGNPDLFVMTLGDVSTPLADGIFDPAEDRVTLSDGTVMRNYYRDTLGIKYYIGSLPSASFA